LKKIKILFVNGGLMDRGGISSFICNYLKCFDFDKFEVYIAVHGFGIGQRDDELKLMGCHIYNLPIKSKSYFKWKKSLKKLLLDENIDIIHANADAGNGPILKIAKQCGIKVRISHSHNTQLLTSNKIRIILNNIQKKQIIKYATSLFACSKLAGEWLYGSNNFEVINNAIDYDQFKFDENKRIMIRKKLDISNETFVIGHVGRFDYQKNHQFILSLANKLMDKNILFLLIGDGHLRKQIEKNIEANNLKNVILLGEIENVADYLNAMDCFIMPSLFEGLSVVSIEAQVNGLKCIFSNTITTECYISKYTIFVKIDTTYNWENIIKSYITEGNNYNRNLYMDKNFDLRIQSIKLQNQYCDFLMGGRK